MLTQSGRWRVWLSRVPRAISFLPRWPNRRLQSTPLAASEIRAILRAPFGYNGITIYPAARLKRNPLGGSPQWLYQPESFLVGDAL